MHNKAEATRLILFSLNWEFNRLPDQDFLWSDPDCDKSRYFFAPAKLSIVPAARPKMLVLPRGVRACAKALWIVFGICFDPRQQV